MNYQDPNIKTSVISAVADIVNRRAVDVVEDMLVQYTEIKCAVDVAEIDRVELKKRLEQKKQADMDAIIPEDVRAAVRALEDRFLSECAEVDEEFQHLHGAASENAEAMKKQIVSAMTNLPAEQYQTIRSGLFMAVAKTASDTIDIKALQRHIALMQAKYPAIAAELGDMLAACTVKGARSVAIQADKKAK